MMRLFFISICVLFIQSVSAKVDTTKVQDSILVKAEVYKTFIGRILSTNNGASLSPSLVLNVSTKSSLDVSLPILPWTKQFYRYDRDKGYYVDSSSNNLSKKSHFLFVTSKVSSADDYNPFISKGVWKPDAEIGLAYTWLIWKRTKFYRREVDDKDKESYNPYNLKYIMPIQDMPITSASQVNFWWVNVRAIYKHSIYNVWDTITRSYESSVFDTVGKSFGLSANVNWYFYPSKYLTPGLAWYVQAGIDYKHQGSNHSDLDKIKGTISKSSTNSGGISIEEEVINIDSRKIYSAKDTFKLTWSLDIPVRATILLNTPDHKFYVGIGYYYNHKRWEGNFRNDMGFNINIPIQQKKEEKESVVNFQLQFVWEDITNRLKPAETELATYRKEKFKVGFTVAAPLMFSHRRIDK